MLLKRFFHYRELRYRFLAELTAVDRVLAHHDYRRDAVLHSRLPLSKSGDLAIWPSYRGKKKQKNRADLC